MSIYTRLRISFSIFFTAALLGPVPADTNELHAAVVAGDLAIIGVGVDNEDVALVALSPISAGEVIFFTDEEWDGTSSFLSGEGFVEWTTPNIQAGTSFLLTKTSASVGGTVNVKAGTFTLGNSGDGVFLYQTADNAYDGAVSSFIAFAGKNSGNAGSLSNTGLLVGANAVYFGGDNGQYIGTRSGGTSFSDYLGSINNSANWATSGSAITLDTTNFSVNPVPEPSTLALAGLGIAVAGLAARRRRVAAASKAAA